MDLRAIDTMVPRPILKHEKYHANAIIMENIQMAGTSPPSLRKRKENTL